MSHRTTAKIVIHIYIVRSEFHSRSIRDSVFSPEYYFESKTAPEQTTDNKQLLYFLVSIIMLISFLISRLMSDDSESTYPVEPVPKMRKLA